MAERFEKIQIQTPDDATVRIAAAFGGPSNEIILVFRFVAEDDEWFESYTGFTPTFSGFGFETYFEHDGQWRNETYDYPYYIQRVNENPSPDDNWRFY
ncbi:MAG: hypothetical protein LBI27_09045 [Clostridiales bacterium]|jgi:hypothetical protein|nr:hypothetical protein [Clostridiales bacterium]